MSNVQRMGRGLDALFNDASAKTENPAPQGPTTTLPLDKIVPNPGQPRRHFAKEALEELAASIKNQGIIQPLLVRPKRGTSNYEIVAGERRWRAAGLAGLKEVPVFVRELSDDEVMAAALIENLQREDLNPIEEALALHSLREQCEMTQEELAARIGKSRSAIANTLRLLQLSMAAQDDLQFGRMNAGHARSLLSLTGDDDAQEQLRQAIIHKQLNVRDAEAAATTFKNSGSFPWNAEPQIADISPQPDMEKEPEGEDSAPAASEDDLTTENAEQSLQTKGSNRAKPAVLKSLQKQMGERLAIKTSISGNEERGRVTFTYTTAQELQQILSIMGLES